MKKCGISECLCNISNTSDSVSSGYPNTEKRVEVLGQPMKQSQLCDIPFQSKQKLRSKRRSKIVKIYAYCPKGGGVLPYKGLMGTCGLPGYVFRDFCLK